MPSRQVPDDLTIPTLGEPGYDSPIRIGHSDRAHHVDFVGDEPSLLPLDDWSALKRYLDAGRKPPLMERVIWSWAFGISTPSATSWPLRVSSCTPPAA